MADERDPKLSQHYRELESLEPPRELDQKILAAARRTTEGAHAPLVAPAGRHRWYYSLAAAAVLVFAVALTMHIERQQPDPEAAAPPSAPTPKAETRGVIKGKPPAAPAELPRAPAFAPDPQSQTRTPESAGAAPAAADQAAPASPAVRQEPRAASERVDEMRARREASSAQRAATAAAKPAPSAAPAPAEAQVRARREGGAAQQYAAPAAAPAVVLPLEKPERWLDRIAELRSRGKHEEADKALAEFRRAYPDYRLSEVMRERVEGR